VLWARVRVPDLQLRQRLAVADSGGPPLLPLVHVGRPREFLAVQRRPRRGAALAARGATPSAFERRCIPAGCVAPSSNNPDILGRRALPSGRLAVLGATMEGHRGPPTMTLRTGPAA